jgi:hypothetical protein
MCCGGVEVDLPLRLGDVEPHEDTDGHGEGAVHEAGLDTKCEEHGWSGIAAIDQLGIFTTGMESSGRTRRLYP